MDDFDSYDDVKGYDFNDGWHKGSYNEEIGRKEGLLKDIFSPEDVLYDLYKQLQGYQIQNGEWVYLNEPVARDQFINYTINLIRSVSNKVSYLGAIDDKEAKNMLWEKIDEYIDAVEDEPTVSEDDTMYLINLVDHYLQIFVSILIGGHGSRVLRQVAASLYVEDNVKSKDKQLINWDVFKPKAKTEPRQFDERKW